MAAPAVAAGARPLRYIPQSNLMSLDPVWTSSIIVYIHSYMVYDTLFGIDGNYDIQPQMCARHELSDDKLTWTFHLRDGLTFHDGEKVLARDCVKSVQRGAVRDPLGQKLLSQTDEIST